MQNTRLWLINERGDIIERSDINFAPVLDMLWDIKEGKEKYPFLIGIDPYGHTYFNLYQTPKVIEELEMFKKENTAQAVLKEINNTIEFLKKVEQGISVKFIGD